MPRETLREPAQSAHGGDATELHVGVPRRLGQICKQDWNTRRDGGQDWRHKRPTSLSSPHLLTTQDEGGNSGCNTRFAICVTFAKTTGASAKSRLDLPCKRPKANGAPRIQRKTTPYSGMLVPRILVGEVGDSWPELQSIMREIWQSRSFFSSPGGVVNMAVHTGFVLRPSRGPALLMARTSLRRRV